MLLQELQIFVLKGSLAVMLTLILNVVHDLRKV